MGRGIHSVGGRSDHGGRPASSLHPVAVAIDVALLGALMVLVLLSRSYWPIWMASAQMLTTISHCAVAFVPQFVPKIYYALSTVWAIPCLGAMVLGIALDRRSGNVIN